MESMTSERLAAERAALEAEAHKYAWKAIGAMEKAAGLPVREGVEDDEVYRKLMHRRMRDLRAAMA